MGGWNENHAVAPKHKSSEKLQVVGWGLSLAYCFTPNKFLVILVLTRYKSGLLPRCSSAQLLPAMFHPSGVKHCPHQKAAKQKKENIPKAS